MSGDNQHFIPRLYLKGFKIRGISGGKQAWVFRPNAEPETGYLDDIAADEHFYSPPDPGSLDDAITKYENKLADRFKVLKKAKIGAFADSALPAEIVAHLTVRTESMRTGFGYTAKQMALKTFQTFQDDEIIKRMLNLDGDVPGDRFKGMIADLLKAHGENLRAIGLSPASVERIAFVMAKEQFPKLMANAKPKIAAVSASLYHKAEEIAASAQRKALSQSMAPEQRVAFLKSLQWEIANADEPAILPDCVAIALQADGGPLPLLLADSEKIEVVVFPLDHKRLLVGRAMAGTVFRPFMYNVHAISCSESFFVSSVRSQKLEDWSKFIGVVSKSTMHEFVKGAFDEYQAPALPHRREPDPPYSIKITFKDATNTEAVKAASEKINSIADWAVTRFSLDRIDEITFANSVSEVAAKIERGIEGDIPDLQPRLARGVTYLKDGHVRVHIVIATAVAETLLGDPQSVVWSNAIYYIVYMLAEAYCNIEFDKAFPGVMLRPHKSLFNHIRYEPVSTAWTGYIASRFSGPFWAEGIEVRRKLLGDAITHMRSGVPLLGASFKEHQNHGRLVGEIIPYITEILTHAATLAGLADAREMGTLEDGETTEIFKVINLAEWYASYVSDLRSIWNRRGQWQSEKEFMSLSRHTERLLWQCGLVLTEAVDGQCRIEFPNVPPTSPAT